MNISRQTISEFLSTQDLPQEELAIVFKDWLLTNYPKLPQREIDRLIDDIHSYPEFTKGGNI